MAAAVPTSFDLYTVKVMASVTMLVVGAATLLATRNTRQVPGMLLFAGGITTIAAGLMLAPARALFGGRHIIFACNVLMLAGLVATVYGIRIFRGRRPLPLPFTVGLCLATVGACWYWLYVHDRLDIRIGVISVSFSLLCADASRSMFRDVSREHRSVYWPTAIAFAVIAVDYVARSVGGFSGGYGPSLFSPVPLELITTILSPLAYVLCAFGMVLASNTILRSDAENLALRDTLTNLPNRRLFMERLTEAESRARLVNGKFGLVYLDLDGFKAVNDIQGHEAGDELLRNVSQALQRAVRSRDCLGRIGGDEFAVLSEDIHDRREMSDLAERLRYAVEEVRIGDGSGGRARVSCGLAVFPEDGASGHDVLREADSAMYVSKQRGRLAGSKSRNIN